MPKRLASTLLRETAGLYVLGVATICLLQSVDLLSVLARFLVQNQAGLSDTGRLLLYKVPWFLHLGLPVAVVFAVLLACGRMAKDSELKAAYSSGVAPASLFWPLVAFGFFVGLLSLVNNGFLEPRGEAAYQAKVDEFLYVRPPSELQVNVAYAYEDGIYFASRMRTGTEDLERAQLSGVLVVSPDGTVTTALDGEWDSTARVWRLFAAERTTGGEAPIGVGTVSLPFALEATPEQTLTRPAELPLDVLVGRLRSVGQAGGDVRELRFDLHRRLADALAAPIFAAFAAAIALRVRGREAGFAWTIVLMVLFWAVWVLSGDLFTSGALGPAVAAWLTPTLAASGAALVAARTLPR
ncbi:MAG TPA: LptF/LptG family permease [Trueperaceae bacterium]|nr:LptF/LptG family permease [Trueperaceae bacterium]